VRLKAVQRVHDPWIVYLPEPQPLRALRNGQKFMRVAVQQRDIPLDGYPKFRVLVILHAPVAAEEDFQVHSALSGQLSVPGSEMLDRVTDDNSETRQHLEKTWSDRLSQERNPPQLHPPGTCPE